jgi:hypothetical protein
LPRLQPKIRALAATKTPKNLEKSNLLFMVTSRQKLTWVGPGGGLVGIK